jgi:hypothetical protein
MKKIYKKKWKLNKFTMDEDVYVEDKDKASSGGSPKHQASSAKQGKLQAPSHKLQAREACDKLSRVNMSY